MKTTKINVTVIRETAKALLVKDEAGRQGWIQRRWFADGVVSSTTFEKAVSHAAERAESAARDADRAREARDFANAEHAVRVVRESEKAVACEIVVEFAGDEEAKLVWFPKSMIGGADGVALIPGWLITSKLAEVTSRPSGSDYYARHRFSKGESVRIVRGLDFVAA